MFIITSISQKPNADGNPSDFVKGYQITSSGTVSEKEYYTADTNVIAGGEYSVGDALIFVTDNKGYINAKTIILALDADDFESGHKHISEGATNSSQYTDLYKGLLIGADMDGTTQIFDLALVNTPDQCENGEVYSGKASSSVKFFVYDSETAKITQQDSFDLSSLASYNATKDTETPQASKLFIYSYYGSVIAVIVVK